MKKILIALALVAIIAFFVIVNVVGPKYSATFNLHGDQEWTKLTYEVTEGDMDKFTAKLDGPRKVKVTYDGEYELHATVVLANDAGESETYQLRLYQSMGTSTESLQVEADFDKVE